MMELTVILLRFCKKLFSSANSRLTENLVYWIAPNIAWHGEWGMFGLLRLHSNLPSTFSQIISLRQREIVMALFWIMCSSYECVCPSVCGLLGAQWQNTKENLTTALTAVRPVCIRFIWTLKNLVFFCFGWETISIALRETCIYTK